MTIQLLILMTCLHVMFYYEFLTLKGARQAGTSWFW